MHYTDLQQILATFEGHVGTTPPNGFPAPMHVRSSLSPVQGFALSNDTQGLDLPVVVAVGANYTQGNVKTPRDLFASSTAVEDDLKSCRKRVDEALKSLDASWVVSDKASHKTIPLRGDYHFVMTNFCIWNTDTRWQEIDPKSRTDLLTNNPSFKGAATSAPNWPHLAQLNAALSSNALLWIAHGIHSEVFSLFRPLIASFGLNHWMMTPNLSYRYFHYGKSYPRP